MRKLMFVAILLAGCSKDPTQDFEKLADKACECPLDDSACGQKALDELIKFADTNKTSDPRKINEAGKRLYDCLSNAGVKPTKVTAALEKMIK
jgi:hypothetical protein